MQCAGVKGPPERHVILIFGRHRIKFHHFHAKQIGQIMRESGVGRNLMFIDQSRVARGHQRSAILHVKFQRVGLRP